MRDLFVEKFLEALRPLVPLHSRVGVAVSGGADSVVLLELLRRQAVPFSLHLSVLHVNHGLRGAESDADKQFVSELACAAGLPFLTTRLTPEAGHNVEQQARLLRRNFFLSHGLDRVALGHTRSDQAETVLHRLLRGAGSTGLGAMRSLTPEGFLRPLVGFSRSEIRDWARTQNLTWRDDSSNADRRFTRNRLRLDLLPALVRDYNPNLEAVLAGTAAVAQAEDDYLESVVDGLFPALVTPHFLGLVFEVEALVALPLALQRRVLRRALSQIRPEKLRGLDFDHVEAVLALCRSREGHDRVLIPGADALRSFDKLLLMLPGRYAEEPRGYRFEITAPCSYLLPGGAGKICLDLLYPDSPVCDTFKKESSVEQVFLAEKAVGPHPLLLRNWEPGDELVRSGRKSPEKLKALFQEYRIKLWERRHWPVLVCGGRIAWAGRFGIASGFESQPGFVALRLIYRTS